MDPCKYDWECDQMLWQIQHQSMSRQTIFGDFNDQPILSNYYNFLNDDDGDDDVNNIPSTPVEYSLLDNKGVEYVAVRNDE